MLTSVFVYLFLRCCTLPRQRNLPLTIMAILVQRASHSSMLQKIIIRSVNNYSKWIRNIDKFRSLGVHTNMTVQ